jgi:organic hydroperoxide reductase OsmC/OhrA
MIKMTAEVHWERGNAKFTDSRYSRGHSWRFDGGQVVPASSSPHVVPLPYSIEANVDPEEAYIAALSSCHMLFYLSLAAAKGLVIESYTDKATGVMEKVDGETVVSRVDLNPAIIYAGERPSPEVERRLHHASHKQCFLANSVKTEVRVIATPDRRLAEEEVVP